MTPERKEPSPWGFLAELRYLQKDQAHVIKISIEELKEIIKKRVTMAFDHKMSYHDFLDWKKAFNSQREMHSGRVPLDRQKFDEAIKKLRRRPTYATFDNPHEFLLLRKFFSEPRFLANFGHECEHVNTARSLGFQKPFMGIFFYLGEKGETRVQYFMHPGPIPEGMSVEEVVAALKIINKSPSWLSEGDRYLTDFMN